MNYKHYNVECAHIYLQKNDSLETLLEIVKNIHEE